MSDKLNENGFDLQDNENTNANNEPAENAYVPGEEKVLDNDNWQFDGVAHTLDDTLITDGELEIEIPKMEESFATRERPKAVTQTVQEKPVQKTRGDSKNTTKFLIFAIILVLALGVLGFFGVRYYAMPNTEEVMNPGNVALRIGDTDVSVGAYNYYYKSVVSTYKQQAAMGYIELDATKSFKEQKTQDDKGNEITWEERFKQDTITQLKSLLAFYEGSQEADIKLSEDEKKAIDEDISSISDSAKNEGITVGEYLEKTYGKYCGIKTLRKVEEWSYCAQKYLRIRNVTERPDEEAVNKYIEEHKDEYYSVSTSYLVVPFSSENDMKLAEKNAKKYAKQFKSADDIKTLLPKAAKEIVESYVAQGYYSTEEQCVEELSKNLTINVMKGDTNLPDGVVDWLFSPSAQVGDTKCVTSTENSVVFIFLKSSEPALAEDEVYTVRHILIMPGGGEKEPSEATKAEWKEAKEKADEIYAKYNEGEKTEYQFALLAEENSNDPGSTSAQSTNYGGIYELVEKGAMVAEFEKWSLDESRKYGDTEIVKTDFGYHIMFFVSRGPRYAEECRAKVKSEGDESFATSLEAKEMPGMRSVEVAVPDKAETTTQTQAVPDTSAPVDAEKDDASGEGEGAEADDAD